MFSITPIASHVVRQCDRVGVVLVGNVLSGHVRFFLISVMLLSCPRHVQEMSRDMSRGHTHVAVLSGHQKSIMSCSDRTFQNMLLKVF
jgi:hypothetical protein